MVDKIIEALEPIIEAIGEIHTRIDGIPVSAQEVVKTIIDSHAEELRGLPGADGKDADPAVDGKDGEDGADGVGITAPAFQSGEVYRSDSIVTHHMGRYYRAVRDTVQEPGDSEDWERVGTLGLRLRGGFDSETVYEAGDMFVKDYGLFMHDGQSARLVAGRGVKGEKGDKGLPGQDGRPGVNGADAVGILAIESRGLTISVVLTDGETILVDLSEAHEKAVEHQIATSVRGEVQRHVKEAVESLVVHPTDGTARPVRFARGEWREGATYEEGDLVSYGDLLYLAIAQSRGEACQGARAQSFWRFFGNASPATIAGGTPGGGGGGGSTDHTQLTGRTENDQHPISAITELENELAKLAPKSSPHFSGVPITPTVPDNTSGGVVASTDYVNTRVANAFAVLAAAYTFDYNKQPTPIALTETFQTVNELTMDRGPGVYLWAVSATWWYTTTNRAVELRFSVDGGQTWGPTFHMEPSDAQDRMPFFYSFPVQHPGGVRRVIMQCRKTSPNGAAEIQYSDLWYQRVGMV